jgi:protein-S-isoprenylcysteine O-methyltransferase Ste14
VKIGQRGGSWVLGQGALLVCVLLVALLGPGWGSFRTPFLVVGITLVAAAAGVGVGAARALGRALTPFPRPLPGAPLAQRRPYTWVRHPMYTAVDALAVGVSLLGSPWALVPTAMLVVLLDRKAAREEAWLSAARPDYAQFISEVRWRFVPGLR